MPYEHQKHHRRSIRLKGYDYAQPGPYFVTLVTYQRVNLFGEIVAGENGRNEMRLSPVGWIVREEWLRSSALRRELRLYEDEFVVMLNHMKGAHAVRPNQMRLNQVRPNQMRPNQAGIWVGDLLT